ncbi:calpain-5 isoform X2 [Xenopus laevis]|uniref:Calpain-5 isoform X2 n=1 Tax=Xenopus laevis TaxID=8355 RepID=A0A8J1LJ06_XENLA|nr:calpain-5 isoform X2 [Xenopus laevis]
MSSPEKRLKNQNYLELKKECIRNGKLFEDPEFPASDESLFFSKAPEFRIEWKRPNELCEDPCLFVDGISSHDLHQGRLGNCWFVAACSCLALRKVLWTKVIPNWKKQEWDPKRPHRYAGIFHFQFWCLGDWIDVVIDDRLPSVDGNLVYCHSNVKNEFWSALLEKAYAKLAGSYEALDGGNTADAIVDFTGAVTESFALDKGHYRTSLNEQTKLFEDLLKVFRTGGLISCYIQPFSISDMETVTPYGLVKGHAYSVTAIKKMPVGQRNLCCFGNSNKLFMIRMRNPWGNREWKGAWSDESEEWNKVSRSEKAALGLTVEDDGEFWMTFEDWCSNFSHADVCWILNTSYLSCYKTWHKEEVHGTWSKNTDPLLNRSGGCFNHKTTFFQNPQYIFEVRKEEDEVLISLQQKDQRTYKKDGKGNNFVIGFEIFKVELNREYRIHKLSGQENVVTSPFINLRAVFLRKELKQGKYVIIPTTYQPGISSNFILRLFTDKPSKFRELLLDKPKVTCWSLLCGYPQRVTQVLVRHVEGVGRQGQMEGMSSYALGDKGALASSEFLPLYHRFQLLSQVGHRGPLIVFAVLCKSHHTKT